MKKHSKFKLMVMTIGSMALALITTSLHAQRTAAAAATVMYGFVVDISVTDGGAGYVDPPAVTLTGGGGSGASAMATMSNGAVSHITVLTTGGGYASTPNIVVAPPLPPAATGAITMALQMAPMLVVDGEPGSTARVSYAEVATPTQWVVISNLVLGAEAFAWCDPVARPGQRRYEAVSLPPRPSAWAAGGTVVVYNGFVLAVAITNGGEGYVSPPSVTFVGDGSGAAAAAVISNGKVTQVTVTNTGAGYSSASVMFSPPPRVTRLAEFQVPSGTVRADPPTVVLLQSSEALAGPERWANLITLLTPSNGAVWFDTTATQAVCRLYRSLSAMALIPADSFFMMGDCLDGDSSALPLHTVQLSAFYMDKYEVTEALWDGVYQWAITHGYNFDCGAAGKAANHPAQSMTWYDAVKWCNARSQKEGRTPAYYTDAGQTNVYRSGQTDVQNGWVKWTNGYRLPTEAEWEKAARGGVGGQRFSGMNISFPTGNTISWSQANYNANPSEYAYDVNPTSGYHPMFAVGITPYTSPVGSFAANGYGLYDMTGNVSEWCWDWSGSYSSALQTDPRGPATGSYRIVRDGGWHDDANGCRMACRWVGAPASRYIDVGFRCVLAAEQP